jgi:hypothetical protein
VRAAADDGISARQADRRDREIAAQQDRGARLQQRLEERDNTRLTGNPRGAGGRVHGEDRALPPPQAGGRSGYDLSFLDGQYRSDDDEDEDDHPRPRRFGDSGDSGSDDGRFDDGDGGGGDDGWWGGPGREGAPVYGERGGSAGGGAGAGAGGDDIDLDDYEALLRLDEDEAAAQPAGLPVEALRALVRVRYRSGGGGGGGGSGGSGCGGAGACDDCVAAYEDAYARECETGAAVATPECAICLDAFAEGQQCTRLPCRHLFHTGCLERWLERSTFCPLCKYGLTVGLDVDGQPQVQARRGAAWEAEQVARATALGQALLDQLPNTNTGR